MKCVSACVAWVIAVSMLLTSGAMAVARGQTHDAVGHIILCIGSATYVAYVDADGQPVEVPFHCPDCALHAFDRAACDTLIANAPLQPLAHWVRVAAQDVTLASAAPRTARAPPPVV